MAWDIVKKITAMVAKAESTPSLAEAEAIMTKVRQMLDQHGVSLLSISEMEARSADPVGTSRKVYGYWRSDAWMRRLSEAAGWYYGVKVVWSSQGNYTAVAAVGRESCRAAFAVMLPYLRLRVMRMARAGVKEGKYRTESRARSMIGNALSHRMLVLAAKQEEAQAEATGRQASAANALVPVSDLEVELKESFPHLRTLQDRNTVIRISLEAVRDAALIDLNAQLSHVDAELRLEKQGTNPK